MELTDLKAAIEDYSGAATDEILALQSRLDSVETKMHRPQGATDCTDDGGGDDPGCGRSTVAGP